MATSFTQTDFDESCLAGLEDALPRADFELLLTDYLASSATRLAQIQVLGAGGNLHELAFEAHTLVSTSGSYGLGRTSALARELEHACKSGSAGQVPALVSELVRSASSGCAALRARFLGASVV